MLTVENTTRTYSGKRGCVCGCMGTYTTSKRARKTAITQMLKNPDLVLHAWFVKDQEVDQGCVYVETNTRIRALFLTKAGVEAARAMGIQEEQE